MHQTIEAYYIDKKKLDELMEQLFGPEGWSVKVGKGYKNYELELPRLLTTEEIDSVTGETT